MPDLSLFISMNRFTEAFTFPISSSSSLPLFLSPAANSQYFGSSGGSAEGLGGSGVVCPHPFLWVKVHNSHTSIVWSLPRGGAEFLRAGAESCQERCVAPPLIARVWLTVLTKSRYYKERNVQSKKRKAIRRWFVSIRHGRHVLSQCPKQRHFPRY